MFSRCKMVIEAIVEAIVFCCEMTGFTFAIKI